LFGPGAGLIPRNPLATKPDSEEGNSLAPVDLQRDHPLQNLLNLGNKAPTREQQLQRRSEFEHILTPASESAAQTAGSLDPVKGLFSVPAAGFSPMNIPATPVPAAIPRVEAPSHPFLAQQERLRAPVVDDLTRKLSPSSAPTPSPAPTFGPGAPRPPLGNQPSTLEFPRRSF
jgi:hypothetical protein